MRPVALVFLALAWMPQARPAAAAAPELAPLVEALRSVQAQGKNHLNAITAWADLTEQADAHDLPAILSGLDGAGPLAANWLRAAIDTIAERHLQQTGQLPTAGLETFLAVREHDPRARRLAYEWIARVDPTASDRLIPGMLDDPSLELRRDAVARLIAAAEAALAAKNESEALATYREALDSARDLDQVKAVTEALDRLGHGVDLAHHYGFLQDWQLVGPFDNRKGVGFDQVYPPESETRLEASYEGLAGAVQWKPHHSDDPQGNVDLNKAIGKHMGAVGYALTEFYSDRARPVELRMGSQNAIKIWLNGKLLTSAEAYHANNAMDQYIGRGQLVPGRNLVLVKVCQNEMTVDWAQDWHFQLRATDASGKAVLSTNRPPAKTAAELAALKAQQVPPAEGAAK